VIPRLFTILSAVSLLLCVATCVLWARSYWAVDVLVLDEARTEGTRLVSEARSFQSAYGGLLYTQYDESEYVPGLADIDGEQADQLARRALKYKTHGDPAAWWGLSVSAVDTWSTWMGFGYSRVATGGPPPGDWTVVRRLVLPQSAIPPAFAVTPAATFLLRLRRRLSGRAASSLPDPGSAA
jgi:hypothetical protein